MPRPEVGPLLARARADAGSPDAGPPDAAALHRAEAGALDVAGAGVIDAGTLNAAAAGAHPAGSLHAVVPAGRVVPGERVAQGFQPGRRTPANPRLSVNPPIRRVSDPAGAAEAVVVGSSAIASPEATRGAGSGAPKKGRALVIGCGALARELLAVTSTVPGLEVACLSPDLHNRPDGIPGAVRARIAEARHDGFERIFVAYADCGTGGLLEPVLAEAGVERLSGAHCYEVFAGSAEFAALADAEPGTFWLTDFLARNFERLVIRGLGIDRHPELQATYFAHYERVVFLSQTEDPDLLVLARRAADRLGLTFEHRPTGIGRLAAPILAFAGRTARAAEDGGNGTRPASVSDTNRSSSRPDHPSTGPIRPESVDPARPASIPGTADADLVGQARGMSFTGRAS